jgi:protease-4
MLPDAFLQTFDLFRKLDLHLHIDQQTAMQARGKTQASMVGNVAVIDLTGKLMKQAASMGGGTSTVQARRDIRAAANDDNVSAILLRIDSPGGTAAGTQELAQEIAAAGKGKPVWAYVDDMAASAAYWAASQADRIIANATAIVGSIGTYGVVQDLSGAAAMQGVKVHVIRAGAHKGAGTPGTEITAEQLQDMQRIVDGLNAHFLSGVQAGRGNKIANLEEIADGRAWLAADAKQMGLIDEIGSFDIALSKLQTKASNRRSSMQASLPGSAVDAALTVEISPVVATTETPQPKAASYAELKAACVGADAAFLCSQLEASATLTQASAAWMAAQNERLEASRQKPGVDAVGTKPR